MNGNIKVKVVKLIKEDGKERRPAGEMYKTIARACFEEWHFREMSKTEYRARCEKLLESSSLKRIEESLEAFNNNGGRTGIKNFIQLGFCALLCGFSKRITDPMQRIYLPQCMADWSEIVIYSEAPDQELRVSSYYSDFSVELQAVVVVAALKKLHDYWSEENKDHTFSIPFELMGFEQAMRYYIFIEPIVQELFKLKVTEEDLENAYFDALPAL